jgi:hypothetical protein
MRKYAVLQLAISMVAGTGALNLSAGPVIVVSDGVTTSGPITGTNGTITYINQSFNGSWSVVVATGVSKPLVGSAANPNLQLAVQAVSLGSQPVRDLTITCSDTDFGPGVQGVKARLTGHVFTGTGSPVSFNTYFDPNNGSTAPVVELTSSGSLQADATGRYDSATNGGPVVAGEEGAYSLIEVMTISGATPASYSLLANVQSTNIVRPRLTITSALQYNPQTDFYEQTVRVFNPPSSDFEYVRLLVSNLTNVPPITVHSFSGFSSGVPFIQSFDPLPANNYVDFDIEYYTPNRVKPNPILRGELVSQGIAVGLPIGTAQAQRTVHLPNGSYVVGFASLKNRTYYVQYSSDRTIWKTSMPPIIGNGKPILWVDNGQPKTESKPTRLTTRYYRVILVP